MVKYVLVHLLYLEEGNNGVYILHTLHTKVYNSLSLFQTLFNTDKVAFIFVLTA
jgi:hypothetical protein